MENFSFKCSKIVKNAPYLKKSTGTVTHECQKVNSSGSNQSTRKVLFTCLANTKINIYIYKKLSGRRNRLKVLDTMK